MVRNCAPENLEIPVRLSEPPRNDGANNNKEKQQ